MKYCIHCGKELPDEARYCSACGKLVEKKEEQPSSTLDLSRDNRLTYGLGLAATIVGAVGVVLIGFFGWAGAVGVGLGIPAIVLASKDKDIPQGKVRNGLVLGVVGTTLGVIAIISFILYRFVYFPSLF